MAFLELTNVCNFTCSFCPKPRMTRPTGFMDHDLARAALAQMGQARLSERVSFHVMGEPLLHPRFADILAFSHSLGLKGMVNTNASVLSPEMDRALLEHADSVLISFRSTNDELLRRNARSSDASFAAYAASIQRLLTLREEMGSATRIGLRVFADAGDTLDALQEIDFMRPLSLHLSARRRSARPCEILPGVWVMVDRLNDYWLEHGDTRFYPGTWGKCDALVGQFAVLWNGDVTTCCYDYDGGNRLGNLGQAPLADILDSAQAALLRRRLERGHLPTPVCRECFGAQGRLRWLARQGHSLGQMLGLFPPKSFV
jgi:sulfatase maturation enzyme AslB (radical SAM superfamily)